MCAWNSISIQIFKWQKIYGGLYSCLYLLWYAKYLLVIWCCHNLPNMNSHQVWEAFSLRGCPTNACLHGSEFQRPSQTEVTKNYFSINTHNQTNTRFVNWQLSFFLEWANLFVLFNPKVWKARVKWRGFAVHCQHGPILQRTSQAKVRNILFCVKKTDTTPSSRLLDCFQRSLNRQKLLEEGGKFCNW